MSAVDLSAGGLGRVDAARRETDGIADGGRSGRARRGLVVGYARSAGWRARRECL